MAISSLCRARRRGPGCPSVAIPNSVRTASHDSPALRNAEGNTAPYSMPTLSVAWLLQGGVGGDFSDLQRLARRHSAPELTCGGLHTGLFPQMMDIGRSPPLKLRHMEEGLDERISDKTVGSPSDILKTDETRKSGVINCASRSYSDSQLLDPVYTASWRNS